MNVFPTQYSVLSAAALNEFIQEQYGYRDTSCKLLIHNVGDTYLIRNSSAKYIFKIYRSAHRNLTEIKGEMELLNALQSGGASVARPLSDLSGEEIQSFDAAEGRRHGVLFAYAEGSVHTDLSDQQLGILGAEMALVHQISSSVKLSFPRPEFNLETMIWGPMERIKRDFTGMDQEYADLHRICRMATEKIGNMDLSRFGYGYCHFDYLPKNFHFTEEGKITFFDFDFAGRGYLVNDLASFYAHFFMHVLFNKLSQQEADRAFGVFVAAYQTVRPLTEEELKAIPYFGICWWMFYFGYHHDHFEDWSNFFYHPRFIKERVGWIKKWAEWYL